MPKSIRDIIQQVGHTKTGKFIQQPSISAFTKRLNYAVFDIKALMDEGEIGEILKDYSISPRGRRYLINAIKAWWEGK